MDEHVAKMDETKRAYQNLMQTCFGKRPLDRTGKRWDYSIMINLRDTDSDDDTDSRICPMASKRC